MSWLRALGLTVDAVVEQLTAGAAGGHRIVHPVGPDRLAGTRVLRYRFRHTLHQRFLFDRLDPVRRAQLHARVAFALEGLGAGDVEELVLPLARHFEHAHRPELAVPYLRRAAARAMAPLRQCRASRRSPRRARSPSSNAARLDADRDVAGAELQIELAIAHSALHGFAAPLVEQAYQRATELMLASAPTREHHPIHFGLWVFH